MTLTKAIAFPLRRLLCGLALVVVSPLALAQAAGADACPYTAAELKQALGLDLAEAKAAAPLKYPGGRTQSCRYENKDIMKPSLWLNMVISDKPDDPGLKEYFKRMAGKMQAIPNDPDGALWQADQGDMTNATLHYLRKGAQVEARVTISPRDKQFDEITARLVKLRRVP